MNIEANIELRRRADLHAALADPARLAIVDALALGDASPSELGALLDMPSNLLAHHLKLLEARQVVRRTRSEGDRRRWYLHLVPETLRALAASAPRPVGRVLFVCTANSARSQLAAALWRQTSAIAAESAGTHPAEQINPGAVAAAGRHQLPLRRRRPRRLDQVPRTDADLVVTVCDRAHEELGPAAGLHWSVPDPVPAGSPAAFDATYTDLAARIGRLAPQLTPEES